jgi:hypothetical protein
MVQDWTTTIAPLTVVYDAGSLTATVPERSGYSGSYILQFSMSDGFSFGEFPASVSVSSGTVTITATGLSLPSYCYFRVSTDGNVTSRTVVTNTTYFTVQSGFTAAEEWTSGDPAQTLALWENGVLTVSVPANINSSTSYSLYYSTDGGNSYNQDYMGATIGATNVSFSLNYPLFSDISTWRIYVRDNQYGINSKSVPTVDISSVGGGGDNGPICFLGNAPVLTPTGYRRIDSLAEGDMVMTAAGESVVIKRVSVTRYEAGPGTNPYVIPNGKFGATRDLLISPNHKVAVGGAMVKAKHLGLAQKQREGEITYYNLELPTWTNMIVAGVEVESLAPVRRVTVTVHQLASLLKQKYGSAATSDAVLQQVLRTCRVRSDGLVDAPVLRR